MSLIVYTLLHYGGLEEVRDLSRSQEISNLESLPHFHSRLWIVVQNRSMSIGFMGG